MPNDNFKAVYSYHPETIIRYFVPRLNKHKHSVRSASDIWFIEAGYKEPRCYQGNTQLNKQEKLKSKVERDALSGPCITRKILNGMVAP